MKSALEVYSQTGNKIFDSEWGNARMIGFFKPDTPSGERLILTATGEAAYKVFAYIVPFREFSGLANTYKNAVWTEGNKILWANLTSTDVTIIYGDGYP